MHREERKKRYIKDFTQAFSENGIDKTSIKKLAKAANINEASIYQYFKNKDEIIVECVKQHFDNMKDELLPAVSDSEMTVDERLAYVMQYSEEAADKDKFIYQVLANPLYSRMCAPIIDRFIDRVRSVGTRLSGELDIAEDVMCSLMFLFCSTVSADRILNDKKVFSMQMEFLTNLLKNVVRN